MRRGVRAVGARAIAVGCSLVSVAACGASGGSTAYPPPEPVGAASPSPAATPAESSSGPRPSDFELEALDGSSVRLSDHLGRRVVLIDFWATFCDPCIVAMPHLDTLYQRHKGRGFIVLGVSIDGPESIAEVRSKVSKTGVTFPILLDEDSRVLARYNPRTSAPFSVLIGRDGRVLKKQEGYTTGSAEALERDIERALAP